VTASFTVDTRAHPPQPIQLIDAAPDADPSTAFAKGFQGGRVMLSCEIHTARVRQFYRRHFEQLSQWLSGLDRARGFRDVDPRQVDEAEHTIATRLHEAHARCTEVSHQAAGQLETCGLADIPIHYTTSVAVTVPIIHPQARTCLEVLLVADNAFASIERLWLLGRIDTRQRRTREADVRLALKSIAAEVRQQYSIMARILRGDRLRPAAVTGSANGSAPSGMSSPNPPPAPMSTPTPACNDKQGCMDVSPGGPV